MINNARAHFSAHFRQGDSPAGQRAEEGAPLWQSILALGGGLVVTRFVCNERTFHGRWNIRQFVRDTDP